MDELETRRELAVRNQSLFRKVNERIVEPADPRKVRSAW